MSATSLKDAQDVIQWIKSNNGHFNTSLLEIKPSPLGGIGVFAKEDINLNDDMPPPVLLRIHKDSLLSGQKSCISNLLFESEITGALALVIAFIYESELKENSPWWAFIKSIKYIDDTGEPILPPSAWSKQEQQLLKGSELDIQGYLSVEELLDSYEKACLFAAYHNELTKGAISIPSILNLNPGESTDTKIPEELKFKHFIAISHALASRNFEIDAFHEVALVPGADLFNHTNDPSVRFESMYEVCQACGAIEGGCDHVVFSDDDDDDDDEEEDDEACQDGCCDDGPHDEEEEEEEQKEENSDHEMREAEDSEDEELVHFEGTMEEFIAAIEEEEKQETEESRQADIEESQELEAAKLSGINIELYSPEIQDIDGKDIHPNACVDITLTRSVKNGDEIFNTYGELPNVVLLNKYGFVIANNEYDTVNLGDAFEKLKKFRSGLFRAHFKFWEERGYDLVKSYLKEIAEEDEDEEETGCKDGCCSGDDGHHEQGEEEESMEDKEDGCCGGKPHSHHEEEDDSENGEQEEDDDDEDTWQSNVDLLSTSEPNAITSALLRLLSLHKVQLIKFTKNAEQLTPWLFKPSFRNPALKKRAQRIWRDVLSFRLQDYEYGDLSDLVEDDLNNVRKDRLQLIKSVVKHEVKILERALDKASVL